MKTVGARMMTALLAVAAATPMLAANDDLPPLRTVPNVDLDRYMGRWYEIARAPNRFQRGLVAVEIEYRLADDGTIKVSNTARRGAFDGAIEEGRALAWVTEGTANTRWRMQFMWPFKTDYCIIDLGENYEYAVVGQPKRKWCWIIARTPTLPEKDYAQVCTRLRAQGYDPASFDRTPQPVSAAATAADHSVK